ncbi:MAG: aspartate kinase [Clostridiales bacterium]|nr:aspartate kinase [Clostridiales bacterium]
MCKVCKFGGTSMADADAIRNVEDIIRSDDSRRVVVVSAPGKRFKDDEKVTDLLYRAFSLKDDPTGFCGVFGKITARYDGIIKDLKLDCDLSAEYEAISQKIRASKTPDYAASRGEYLSALITAKYLGFDFIDAKDCIRFDSSRVFDPETTNGLLGSALSGGRYAVLPGFYGADARGEIVTFSRGGSDVTGSIAARAAKALVYENWTDVDGFLTADPRIVDKPELIETLSYKELRELSYMGASVLHHEAIFPVRKEGIPINVKNTFDKTKAGTMILPAAKLPKPRRIVTGIAGKKNYSVINIEKSLLNNEIGFVRKVLSILEKYGISFEHMPTGIDTMSIILADSEFKIPPDRLVEEIKTTLSPDSIAVYSGLSLIAVVGHGMENKKGTAAQICGALFDADINIRMIDQGSSEINIIVAVGTDDYERAVNAVYDSFFRRGASRESA